MKKLSDDDVISRLEAGKKFISNFVRTDKEACNRYRDGSADPIYHDPENNYELDELLDDAPVGITNMITANIIVKLAMIGMGTPDWYVKCKDPDNEIIVRKFLQEKWRTRDWIRLTNKVLQKRFVSGMGFAAFRYDKEKRSCWEHVQSWDLAICPHTINWAEIPWAARKIRMPVEEAIETYGKKWFSSNDDPSDTVAEEIWVYWDDENEIHISGGEVIKRNKNLYGCVPILVLEGDLDPSDSIWGIGDFTLAQGTQVQLSDLNEIINYKALHEGSITVISKNAEAALEQLENGVLGGIVVVPDASETPITRVQGAPLDPNLMTSKQSMEQSIDILTGVSGYDRGVISEGTSPKFATEVATISQKSGSRAIQLRVQFEQYVSKMAEITLLLEKMFGGPQQSADSSQMTDEEMILWEAVSDVIELYCVENSTVYKDQAIDVNVATQLLGLAQGLVGPMAQMGGAIPNIQRYMNDLLRSSGKNNVDDYWIMPAPQSPPTAPGNAPQGQQMPPQGQQMPPQGQQMPPQGQQMPPPDTQQMNSLAQMPNQQ